MKILLIEDDVTLCDTIKTQLTKEGHLIDACHSGEEGLMLALAPNSGYELAIIDRMLPVIDGLAIVRAIREKQIPIPVIIITGMSELEDKIEGLDNGADDYLVKPFHVRELSARIRALNRRPPKTQESTVLNFGDLSLDCSSQQLKCGNKTLTLTPKEFHLLCAFLKKQSTVSYNPEIEAKMASASSGSGAGAGGGNERDAYFVEAGKFVIEKEKGSIGMLQRMFKVGFNRAARIMDQLEEAGVVGPEEGTKPRKILMSLAEFEEYVDEYV